MRAAFLTIAVVLAFASATSARDLPPWQSRIAADHSLVGRIWRIADGVFVAPETLIESLAGTAYVFVGEKHDNPDHHRLQAWILEALVARGKRPAVAWEMIGESRQAAIDAYIEKHPRNAAGLGKAVDWTASGWPPWSEYQPIAEVALASGLRIVAGNLAERTVRAVGRNGLAALPDSRRARLGLDKPLPSETVDTLLTIVAEAHCGLMPRPALGPMVDVQRARDAALAENMVRARAKAGAVVLIAGDGHARRDFGTPRVVAALDRHARIAALAILEVQDGDTDPAAYAKQFGVPALPFDYVWFTPRANDRDYCAELKQQFREQKDNHAR